MTNTEILRVSGINKAYTGGIHAVRNISLNIEKGECLGMVGESGSGKSTLARCVLTLERIDTGEIWLDGQELTRTEAHELRRGRQKMQAVFQNPTASLNSKLTIYDSLMEPLRCRRRSKGSSERNERETASRLMEMVRLSPDLLGRFPRELSGGQKQRVCIARAISVEPALIVLDEPTSSLDVSIQAMTLNLLKDLQEKLHLSYLFISHDLSAVQFMSEKIIVMRDGMIVDRFDRSGLFMAERHEYTKKLIAIFE